MQHIKKEDMPEWIELYHATNQMLLEIGEKGFVAQNDEVVRRVMDALFEIDGGVYNKRM